MWDAVKFFFMSDLRIQISGVLFFLFIHFVFIDSILVGGGNHLPPIKLRKC